MREAASATASSSGVGFFGLLTIVLITLKLLGLIQISWWWVFSPMLFSFGVFLLFLLVFLGIPALIVGIAFLVTWLKERK